MTVRKRTDRKGKARWFIDIRFRTAGGKRRRVRQDAQPNTKDGAIAQERRMLRELQETGDVLTLAPDEEAEPEGPAPTFGDAVKLFRRKRLKTLKPSTRWGYEKRLEAFLVPRFEAVELANLGETELAALDAELVRDGLKPSTRRGIQIVFRSVMRAAVDGKLIASMPKLPSFPRVRKKVSKPMYRDDLDAIMAVCTVNTRLALGLAAYAGLRAGEVRALQWEDVDLRAEGGWLHVRRSLSNGEETTPKSGEARKVPIAAPLRTLLEAAQKAKRGKLPNVSLTKHGAVWGQAGLNQAFERAQEKAKRTGWSFHDLRRFCGTELERLGAPLSKIQEILGHAEVTTTMLYIGSGSRDLEAAMALWATPAGATVGQRENEPTQTAAE